MLTKPRLILDPVRCKRNIKRITQKSKKLGLEYRPHFKTHQSVEIGRWFRNEGVSGITVSSISMASYFAEDGWDDITIAFPFYNGMIEQLQKLEEMSKLRLFLHRVSDIEHLNSILKHPFKVYIEIDAGYGRSGIAHNDYHTLDQLIEAATSGSKSQFHGFYIHDGGTYRARGIEDIKERILNSHYALQSLKKRYPQSATSLGDTPSASVLDKFEGIDEITPGNLVFYDWMQVQIGSCEPNDVAVWVDVPVAQVISDSKAIVHGGAVHFSKDYVLLNGVKIFGQPLKLDSTKLIPAEACYLSALSQEHGTLTGYTPDLASEDGFVSILPIHSCLTVNLFNQYETPDGRLIQKKVLS